MFNKLSFIFLNEFIYNKSFKSTLIKYLMQIIIFENIFILFNIFYVVIFIYKFYNIFEIFFFGKLNYDRLKFNI